MLLANGSIVVGVERTVFIVGSRLMANGGKERRYGLLGLHLKMCQTARCLSLLQHLNPLSQLDGHIARRVLSVADDLFAVVVARHHNKAILHVLEHIDKVACMEQFHS